MSTMGLPDPSGSQTMTIGSYGPLWVAIGAGHVRIQAHGSAVYPFRKRMSPRGRTMIAAFVAEFQRQHKLKVERETTLRVKTLTLTEVLDEINSRIRSLKASYDDDVWGERPNGDNIGSQVSALEGIRDFIKYRLTQG